MDLRIPEQPKLLQFETNTLCSGGCTFCRYGSMKKRPEMPLHRIVDLTYHLAHKVREVFPFYMQDPLLESRLLPILSNVKLFNPRGQQTLYTNMGRYPEATLKKIVQWGLVDLVVVSFYGGCKKLHEEMQPGTPYARTKRYIKQFVKLRDSLGWVRPKIMLAYLITKDTLPFLKDTLKEWSGIAPVGVFRWDSWCGRFPYDEDWETRFWGSPPEREPCRQLWNGIYINSQGDLLPCCMDCDAEMKVGNVFRDGYEAWWNSEKLNFMRRLHLEHKWDEFPMCRACTKWRWIKEVKPRIKDWQAKIECAPSAMNV